MKKILFSSQFIFLLLALALLSLTIFQHNKNKEDEVKKREDALVFDSNFRVKDAHLISIKNVGGGSFIFEKIEDQWMIQSPVQDRASNMDVENLVSRILSQEATLILEENTSWSEYDLEPPLSVIKIQTNRQTKQVGISSEPNYEGSFYIQDEKKLLLGSSEWERFTRLKVQDYASKKLHHFSKDPVQINYKNSKLNYKFKKNKDQWEWMGSEKFPLSQRSIEEWLSLFRKDIISSFTRNKKSDQEKKYLESDLTVEFLFEDQKTPWVLKFQSVPESLDQVVVSDRSYVYELKKKNGLMDVDFKEHPPKEKESKEQTSPQKETN